MSKSSLILRSGQVKHKKKLEELSIQSKALEVVKLENTMCGRENSRASLVDSCCFFLYRAGTDTLPTPLNLRRWHLPPALFVGANNQLSTTSFLIAHAEAQAPAG